MPEITDSGKIWIKGQSHTSFAVKVDDTVFVTGKEEGPALEAHWIEKNRLCVDLHDLEQGSRIARRFSLDQKPTHPAALFSGFNKTKHADLVVCTHNDPGVEEFIVQGNDYKRQQVESMNREEFWKLAGFPKD